MIGIHAAKNIAVHPNLSKSDVKNTQNLNNSNKGQMVLEKMKLGVHSAFNDKCIDNICVIIIHWNITKRLKSTFLRKR